MVARASARVRSFFFFLCSLPWMGGGSSRHDWLQGRDKCRGRMKPSMEWWYLILGASFLLLAHLWFVSLSDDHGFILDEQLGVSLFLPVSCRRSNRSLTLVEPRTYCWFKALCRSLRAMLGAVNCLLRPVFPKQILLRECFCGSLCV